MANILKMTEKDIKQIIIISTLLFFFTSIVFGTFEGDQDGKTLIGFPFIFSSGSSGKCGDCEEVIWFKPFFLVLDIIIAQVVAFFILLFVKRFRKS